MANLQVKNVPDSVHEALRALAAREGKTVREVVLEAVERELARSAWVQRHRTRGPVRLGSSAAELVDEVRREREEELGP